MIHSLFYKASIEKIAPLNLPSYLEAQPLFPKFYHRCQDSGEERAAFGSLVSLPYIPKLSQDIDPSLCFYGALRFPCKKADPLWAEFPSTLFFLPLYEIRQNAHETTLLSRPFPSIPLPSPSIVLPSAPILHKVLETPSREKWSRMFHNTLEQIQSRSFDKVILSKKTTFSYEEDSPFFSFVEQLKQDNPSTSTFAWQMHPSSLFLGSSPERLYQRKENIIKTEAIAGTRKRNIQPLEDLKSSQDLQNSIKDQQEVLYVKKFLEEKLSPLCLSISHSNTPKIIPTRTLWHLRYLFEGILHSQVTDFDLLTALHPTPAVGGSPRKEALDWIHEIESYSRGLYAGSIGWTSPLEASFTVAIRSALAQKNKLHAFTGVGIVPGSNEELEWEELEHKLSHWNLPCLI